MCAGTIFESSATKPFPKERTMIIKFYIARTRPTTRVRVNTNQKVRVIKRNRKES